MSAKFIIKVLQPVVEDRKRYIILRYVIWTIAILSMTALLIYHSTNLLKQYIGQRPVVNVEYVDNSTYGIHLPDGTMCISFYRHVASVKKDDDLHTFLLKYYAMTRYDAESSTFVLSPPDRNFEKLAKDTMVNNNNDTSSPPPSFKQLNEETVKFWRFICDTIQLQMFSMDDAYPENVTYYPICDMVAQKQLPFTVNRYEHLCFRLPLSQLYLFEKQQSTLNSMSRSGEFDQVYEFNQFSYYSTKKKFNIQFNPATLKAMLNQDLRSVYIYFPEQPTSYAFQSEDDLKRALESLDGVQYFYELKEKDCFKHFRTCHVNVDVRIKQKYIGLNDDIGCTDVYDQRQCIIECKEKDFFNKCGCKRYLFASMADVKSSKEKFCTYNDYKVCTEKMKKEYGNNSMVAKVTSKVDRCFNQCSTCTKLSLDFSTREDYTFPRGGSLCDAILPLVNPVLNVSCPPDDSAAIDRIVEKHPNFVPIMYSIIQMLKSIHNVSEFKRIINENDVNVRWLCRIRHMINDTDTDECESITASSYLQVVTDKDFEDIYNLRKPALWLNLDQMFGQLEFRFSVASFVYPQFTEMIQMSAEEFFSQIGGILGLYLGVSGLTIFTMILAICKSIHKQIMKQKSRYT